MKIGFFEVERWADAKIEGAYPQAVRVRGVLDETNVGDYKNLQIVSTFCYSPLSKEVLSQMPKLVFIATRSTGFNHIDIDYCKKKRIVVSNVPVYGRRTVTEHTFGLMLALTRKLYESIHRTKEENSFSIEGLRGVDLFGKTLGVVGMGKIGAEVVKRGRAFGMDVLVNTRTQDPDLASDLGFEYCELDHLLRNSDIITLHLPLTKQTEHIINKENITKIKRGAYLINTARGGLVESEALLIGLEKGILEGVGLDVLEEELSFKEEAELLSSEYRKKVDYEAVVMDHILIKHPKVLVTPHNAFHSIEALHRILDRTFSNIENYLKGTPENVVIITQK